MSLSGGGRRENSIGCPHLAAELVRLKVNIIVAAGPAATRPAKEATATIPIVMAQRQRSRRDGDRRQPCAAWWEHYRTVQRLPPEISGKQLELLKEIVPKLSRVAVFEDVSLAGQPDKR